MFQKPNALVIMDKKLSKKEIADISLKLINETYGYGRGGTHKKKCDICGMLFDESNDLDVLMITGPAQCPHCKEINSLKNELIKHWNEFMNRESDNPLEHKNMIKDENYEDIYPYVKTESYTLDKYEKSFEIIGRTKRVQDYIDRVQAARKYLYEVVEPQMKILESLYERKDLFWKYGGNLHYHIRNASVQFVVIKLKEYLGSSSKYSVHKLKNIIRDNKQRFFNEHCVVEVKRFEKSGDIMKTEYPHFEIDKYLDKLDDVLKSYAQIINAISDYRDTQFAHIDELKNPETSSKSLTYYNIKRVFNSLKIIYDGFYYSIAPDLFTNLFYDHQLWFDYLNQIAKEHESKNKKGE